jgi:hypothetical protein
MHSGSLLWLLQVKYTHRMDGWDRLMILQMQRLPLRFRPSLSSLLVYIQEVQKHYSTTSTGRRRRRRRRGTEHFSFFSTDVGNNLKNPDSENSEDANCKGQRGRPPAFAVDGPGMIPAEDGPNGVVRPAASSLT